MTAEIDVTGLDAYEQHIVTVLAETDPQHAASYADAVRPGYAVIVAGYDGADDLAQARPRSAPHWSGVVFWPFTKGEVVRLVGGPDGREPDGQGRRPAKWPVAVEWFGTDQRAAARRSHEVCCAIAQCVLDDTPGAQVIGRLPIAERTCAWCGVKGNVAGMEPINSRSVACRDVRACQRRIEEP